MRLRFFSLFIFYCDDAKTLRAQISTLYKHNQSLRYTNRIFIHSSVDISPQPSEMYAVQMLERFLILYFISIIQTVHVWCGIYIPWRHCTLNFMKGNLAHFCVMYALEYKRPSSALYDYYDAMKWEIAQEIWSIFSGSMAKMSFLFIALMLINTRHFTSATLLGFRLELRARYRVRVVELQKSLYRLRYIHEYFKPELVTRAYFIL